jgi:hypothetical protein
MNDRQQPETYERIEDLTPEARDAESVTGGKNVAKFKVSSELSAIVTK